MRRRKRYFEDATREIGSEKHIKIDHEKYSSKSISNLSVQCSKSSRIEVFIVDIHINDLYSRVAISIHEPKFIYIPRNLRVHRSITQEIKDSIYELATEYWKDIICSLKELYSDERNLEFFKLFHCTKDPSKIIYPDSPPDYRLLP